MLYSTGERREEPNVPNPSTTGGAYSLGAVVSAVILSGGVAAELQSCCSCIVAALSESMLDHCVACAGMTVVGDSGFPIYYNPSECPEKYHVNVESRNGGAVRESDLRLAEGPDNPPLAALTTGMTFPRGPV